MKITNCGTNSPHNFGIQFTDIKHLIFYRDIIYYFLRKSDLNDRLMLVEFNSLYATLFM